MERKEDSTKAVAERMARSPATNGTADAAVDDVIGGHAQVRGAVLEHPQHGGDDAAHRAQFLGRAPVEGRRRREEVAEQLDLPDRVPGETVWMAPENKFGAARDG
jgi:hypothetical protein